MAIFLVSNLNMPFFWHLKMAPLPTTSVLCGQCYGSARCKLCLSHWLDGFLYEGYFFVGEVVHSVKLLLTYKLHFTIFLINNPFDVSTFF